MKIKYYITLLGLTSCFFAKASIETLNVQFFTAQSEEPFYQKNISEFYLDTVANITEVLLAIKSAQEEIMRQDDVLIGNLFVIKENEYQNQCKQGFMFSKSVYAKPLELENYARHLLLTFEQPDLTTWGSDFLQKYGICRIKMISDVLDSTSYVDSNSHNCLLSTLHKCGIEIYQKGEDRQLILKIADDGKEFMGLPPRLGCIRLPSYI